MSVPSYLRDEFLPVFLFTVLEFQSDRVGAKKYNILQNKFDDFNIFENTIGLPTKNNGRETERSKKATSTISL